MPWNVKGECRNTGRTHFKKGEISGFAGRSHSAETIQKIKDSIRNRISGFLGKHHSEETRKNISLKISASLKGNKRAAGKPWSQNRRKAQAFVIRKPSTLPRRRNSANEYDPFWSEIRNIIYRRDKWKCRECGLHCHGNGTKDRIQCHHIDFDKKNNNSSNLITLCAVCHSKTFFHSKADWIGYYNEKQKKEADPTTKVC